MPHFSSPLKQAEMVLRQPLAQPRLPMTLLVQVRTRYRPLCSVIDSLFIVSADATKSVIDIDAVFGGGCRFEIPRSL